MTSPPPEDRTVDVPAAPERPPAVCARELGFSFGRQEPPVLQGVSFTIGAGERVALVGPNGAGKSMLLALVAGLLRPTHGWLQCAAFPVAMVPQNPDLGLMCTSVADELRLGPQLRGEDPAEASRRANELAHRLLLADRLADPPHALSQGQRLRIAVAAALAVRPGLLLMDEPTLGQESASELLMCLDGPHGLLAPQATLVFATHDLEVVARFAERVLVLHQGRLLADLAVGSLLEDATLLEAVRLRPPAAWRALRRLGLDAAAALAWLRRSHRPRQAFGLPPTPAESYS